MYRMIRISSLLVIAMALCVGCEPQPAEDLVIERLPDVTPSLPSVPTIPPDPYPIQLSDGSYTVLGVKRRGHHILDGENTDRSVQGPATSHESSSPKSAMKEDLPGLQPPTFFSLTRCQSPTAVTGLSSLATLE